MWPRGQPRMEDLSREIKRNLVRPAGFEPATYSSGDSANMVNPAQSVTFNVEKK